MATYIAFQHSAFLLRHIRPLRKARARASVSMQSNTQNTDTLVSRVTPDLAEVQPVATPLQVTVADKNARAVDPVLFATLSAATFGGMYDFSTIFDNIVDAAAGGLDAVDGTWGTLILKMFLWTVLQGGGGWLTGAAINKVVKDGIKLNLPWANWGKPNAAVPAEVLAVIEDDGCETVSYPIQRHVLQQLSSSEECCAYVRSDLDLAYQINLTAWEGSLQAPQGLQAADSQQRFTFVPAKREEILQRAAKLIFKRQQSPEESIQRAVIEQGGLLAVMSFCLLNVPQQIDPSQVSLW
eukprot:jgi/Chrzof1/1437/Cz10g07280.t1